MSAALDDHTQYRLALRASALAYVAKGWAVVPLSRMLYDEQGRKHVKRLIRWQRDPDQLVRTPEQVERWFGLTGQAEGLAIATGPSGLMAVDVDSHKASYGGTEPPPGGWREQHVGRGGVHVYYANPDGQRNTAGALGTAVDTRGDGGLMYAAPTRCYHADGRLTQWQTERPLSELPAPGQLPSGPAVADRRREYQPVAAVAEPTVKPRDEAYSIVAAKRAQWLASQEGSRHETLMDFGGTLARVLLADGLAPHEVYARLDEEVAAHPDAAEFETAEKDTQDCVRYATANPWVFGVPDGLEGRFAVPDPGEAPALADVGDGGDLFAGGDPEYFHNPPPPPMPTYGSFGGKLPLFYSDGVHWLQGESESGKSWVAFAVVIEVLRTGGWVLIVDHEDTRGNVLRRLQAMGMTVEQYARLVYAPGADVTHAELRGHLAATDRAYAAMVVDGVTSALTAAGLSGRDEQETTRWVDQVPRQARMSICIDHVVKATDERRGMAIGTQAKKAVVTGSAWEVVALSPIGRGRSGLIELRLQKDKGGYLRGELGKAAVRLDFVSDRGGERVRIGAQDRSSSASFMAVESPFEQLYASLYENGTDGGISGREILKMAKAGSYRCGTSSAARSELLDGWREYYSNRANTESSEAATLPGSRGWVAGVGPGPGSDPP